MNKYKILYWCDNGFMGTEEVYAANRIAAFELFKSFGHEDVVNVECYRVLEDKANG